MTNDINKNFELDDNMLDEVVGGINADTDVIPKYEIGDTVKVKSYTVNYCERCGRLLLEYEATITGVRGTLDGFPIYWITRKCCGFKSCTSERSILSKL